MSGIPEPHGGALVNGHSKMDVAGMEEIKVSASIQSEIENIADGIFSPLVVNGTIHSNMLDLSSPMRMRLDKLRKK